jgi:hypothetical protein
MLDTRVGQTEGTLNTHDVAAEGRTANGRTETYVEAAWRGKDNSVFTRCY